LTVAQLEALLYQRAMRDDIEAPSLEVGDLVLRFADDDLDDRLVKPRGLRFKLAGLVQKCGAGGVVALRRSLRLLGIARISAAFAFHRGTMRSCIRAQMNLSTQISRDFLGSHRAAQCSTKSAAILSSRSSAVMTS
jgi:hypothetical protein